MIKKFNKILVTIGIIIFIPMASTASKLLQVRL
jgi:hypothetical protein